MRSEAADDADPQIVEACERFQLVREGQDEVTFSGEEA
jgi:hypothetical protein